MWAQLFGDVSIANLCTEGKAGGFFRELCVTSVNCTCDQGIFIEVIVCFLERDCNAHWNNSIVSGVMNNPNGWKSVHQL